MEKESFFINEVILVKTNDYVKYITQTFVKYMDQPKEERKKKKEAKEDLLYKWFGLLPFALNTRRKRKNN